MSGAERSAAWRMIEEGQRERRCAMIERSGAK
jgi:hypothetical protein